ncbi:MAG: DUF763 domain-containing protein [Candidatus Pacearchaeota archaeon]|nr:DUF763 domain-containing protein [Candidatus Pacearchaeota archaeon]
MLRGTVDLPLHYGSSPRWLFERMTKLAKAITEIIVNEYGKEEFLKRLSEPYWFQSFACVLGFDWHSSGTTTVTMGALKEALKTSELSQELIVVGGKGKISRKTPEEIEKNGENLGLNDKKISELIKASKLAAKVDNSALQDGFQLYHHSLIFSSKGNWAIIQQGMNDETSYARRYHWFSSPELNFVNEPHAAIASDIIVKPLNMIAKEAEETRKCSVDLIKDNPIKLKKLKEKFDDQKTLASFIMPKEHFPKIKNIKINFKALQEAYEIQLKNYEELLLIRGIGPSTIRALALISNLIYGSELSWRDPCKFSFAHGGKDGWPYPVNKEQYDKSIALLKEAIEQAKLDKKEKIEAIKRLKNFI